MGFDPRGSHLLVADLDDSGEDEIVLAGNEGQIMVLDGTLAEFLDHDADPATVAPFARGTYEDAPVTWHLPPVVVPISTGDTEAEILLSSPQGLFAFENTGQPVVTQAPGFNGLLNALPGCTGSPVVVPVTGMEGPLPAPPWVIVPYSSLGSPHLLLTRHSGSGDEWTSAQFSLGTAGVSGQPLAAFDRVFRGCARHGGRAPSPVCGGSADPGHQPLDRTGCGSGRLPLASRPGLSGRRG